MELNPTGKLAEALAKAQGEMSNPKFDKMNPHFRNKFASLAAVRDAVIPILAKHGIACVQDICTTETGRVACKTYLMHSSGESFVFGPIEMPVSKGDAQGFGSAATYARRYHLMAVANVVGDEDDDANEATGKSAPAVGIEMGEVQAPDANVTKYAIAMRKAVASTDAEKVYAVHMDLHAEGEEMYRTVWTQLDAKTRAKAKDIIDLKKMEKAAA